MAGLAFWEPDRKNVKFLELFIVKDFSDVMHRNCFEYVHLNGLGRLG